MKGRGGREPLAFSLSHGNGANIGVGNGDTRLLSGKKGEGNTLNYLFWARALGLKKSSGVG